MVTADVPAAGNGRTVQISVKGREILSRTENPQRMRLATTLAGR